MITIIIIKPVLYLYINQQWLDDNIKHNEKHAELCHKTKLNNYDGIWMSIFTISRKQIKKNHLRVKFSWFVQSTNVNMMTII